jgi:subtilase family serine protease
MRKAKTSLSAALAAGALVAAGMAAAPSADASPHRRSIARTAPKWVAKADSLGKAPASGRSDFRVYLAPQGGLDALKAAVAEVSDPASPGYRHFLSAAQYHKRYDATTGAVSQVRDFLRGYHLSVTSVEAHHRYLAVRGSNAAVERAFGVSMKRYRHRGRVVQTNTTAVTVPAGIAGLVTTVKGLDTTPHRIAHHHTRPAAPPGAGFRNARPCSRYYGQVKATYQADYRTPLPKLDGETLPYAPCGYTGPQYRAAYEGNSALDGSGVTVAITDAYASPTIVGDSSRYATRHGDGSYAPGQLVQVKDPTAYNRQQDCGPSGWYGEETLDVEAVHAMAPGANIRYYASPSCYDDDFLDTLARVVDDDQASLVSNSWSDLEASASADSVAAYEQVFLQGAMQGIGFLFSSGDSGDELAATAIKQVDYPASDPYVTAVGGTADAINAVGQFDFQTGWGTDKYSLSADGTSWTPAGYLYGAGGGTSGLFNRPAYQDGVVPARYGSGRAVPDVGLDADPTTGMLIGQTQLFTTGKAYGEYRIGGTSLASPLFAGMSALTEQEAGSRVGFLNPAIYANAGTKAFADVRGKAPDAGNVRVDFANGEDASGGLLYSVRTFNDDSSLKVRRGWDDVTGVGSPRPGWLTSIAGATAASSSR